MKLWNPQYKTLDHWRGFAALWVMLFHGFGTTYSSTLHPGVELLKAIAAPGWLGVHLFFVISGYCITASLYNLGCKQGKVWTFLKNRFWRLYPTYWMAFLLALILNLLSSPFNEVDVTTFIPNSWREWFGNIFLIQPYLGASYYVVVYWSLVVEVGFYLITASLFVTWNYMGAKTATFIGLILAGVSLMLTGTNSGMLGPIETWSEFLCGVLVFNALFARSQTRTYLHHFSLILILILGAASLGLNLIGLHNWLWFSALFALSLYLLYNVDHKIAEFRALHWLQFIGLMSYSLYLLHVPLQGRVINLGFRFIPLESPLVIVLQVLGWAVAIAASYIFYCFIEKPFNDFRRKQKLSIT